MMKELTKKQKQLFAKERERNWYTEHEIELAELYVKYWNFNHNTAVNLLAYLNDFSLNLARFIFRKTSNKWNKAV